MDRENMLCIIPARGGSIRIPSKNIKSFRGKPILAYSIESAICSDIADEIMVSTDSEDIAKIAQEYGANVPFMRSEKSSNNFAGIAEVLIEVIDQYKKLGKEFNYIMCILATAPLLTPDKLKKAFEQLRNDEKADSICSVVNFSYPPQRCLVYRNGYMEMLYPENYYLRGQDLEQLYHDCGQFFIFRTDALLRDRKLYTRNTLPFFIDEMESQDIDNITDWNIAELKYSIMMEKRK